MDGLRGVLRLGRGRAPDRSGAAAPAGRLIPVPGTPAPAPGGAPPEALPDAGFGASLQPHAWRRWTARHPLGTDVAVACCVALVGLPMTVHQAQERSWVWVLDLALALPLVWRRRNPPAVFAVLAAAALLQWVLGVRLSADVGLLVALYTVAAWQPRRTAVAAAAVLEVGVFLAAFRFAPARGLPASIVFLSGLVAAAFFIGTTVQTRRAYLGALVDRAARAERERDQQARLSATAERARLARELHDVVAHSLTVVVTLAEAAVVAGDSDPPAAKQAMTQVATTGRTALAELRRLLGVLRADPADEGAAALTPVPGLDALDDLVGSARAAGLPVRLTVGGRPRTLPSTADTTAYRLIQESLTNVLKHAVEPSRVEVLVQWTAEDVVLSVTDDGRSATPRTSGGHGLPGMRERLALFGGELSAGPGPAGGWAVRARLPYPVEEA